MLCRKFGLSDYRTIGLSDYRTIGPRYFGQSDHLKFCISVNVSSPSQTLLFTMPPISLSVVVLCYQTGEEAIPVLKDIARSLEKADIDFELLPVANYWDEGKDDTPRLLKDWSTTWEGSNPVRVLAEHKKGGMGWDFRNGLDNCKGEVCAVIDGDGQYPADSIVECYNKLLNENLDLCKTYRTSRSDSAFRHLTSFGFNLLFKSLFPDTKARDINSKPKVMSKSTVELMQLESDDWFIDAEIMIKAGKSRLRIGEIPIEYTSGVRESFVRPLDIKEFLVNLKEWRGKL